jgi:anaerobic magnesium-protoporphyrin IX monomethyl ester cyclase
MNKNVDVVLINPYDENAVKNALGFITPPLNLMYLASSLEAESYSVKIIDDDLLQQGYERVAEQINKINPPMVGVTAGTSTIKSALKYLEQLKKILPDVLTVIGGPHTTFMPYETLKGSKYLDVVVMGEGEETIVELADHAAKNNRDIEDIKGIVYRDSTNGKLKTTEKRPLIKDLGFNSISCPTPCTL